TERGVDNNSDPKENDGKIYEMTLSPISTGNTPPVVSAGPDQNVTLPGDATLGRTVSDDGLPNPPAMVTTIWSRISGPGAVTFADDSAVDTTASFSSPGTYMLRLTADDGELTSSDEVTIIVTGSGGETIIEIRVSAGSDDAEERAKGHVGLTSPALELVFAGGGDQTVGMRFSGVNIPRGATILNAVVQFQAVETNSVVTSLTIEGEGTDNASTFISSKWNISSRNPTAASVIWAPLSWTTVGDAGPAQLTPNIKPIIQEIVNKSGWSSGNSLVIIITGSGERVAEAFDGVPSAAPLLHVEYIPTSSNQAPTAAFTLSCTDLTCDFTDGSSDGDGSVVSWSWGFGDGATSVELNPSHTYAAGGTYTVTLTVTDDGGAPDSASQGVSVSEPVHVGDLHGDSSLAGQGGKWNATVTVIIHDVNENPIADTTVAGTWSAGANGSGSCATDTNGECSVTRNNINRNRSSVTFTVSNVSHASSSYLSGDNHDLDGDSNGTSIVVFKP
ncbi:MAG: PKD domain-containing protein, partial [Gemmatimonadales bacterium]